MHISCVVTSLNPTEILIVRYQKKNRVIYLWWPFILLGAEKLVNTDTTNRACLIASNRDGKLSNIHGVAWISSAKAKREGVSIFFRRDGVRVEPRRFGAFCSSIFISMHYLIYNNNNHFTTYRTHVLGKMYSLGNQTVMSQFFFSFINSGRKTKRLRIE